MDGRSPLKLSLQRVWWALIKMVALVSALAYARGSLPRGGVLVDVGGRNGLQRKWRSSAVFGLVDAFLIEPDVAEAQRLRESRIPATVIEAAVGDIPGPAMLYATHNPNCSSLRRPLADVVGRYSFADMYEVVGLVPVEVDTIERLVDRGAIPPPSYLKIDVQGYEFEVLKGVGRHMAGVVGVELEANFERLYEGQAMFSDVYDWLTAQGFGLVAIRPQGVLDHNIVEANCFFGRNPATLDADGRTLYEFWRRLNRILSAPELAIRTM
jgi:FkbM family methyltransferase